MITRKAHGFTLIEVALTLLIVGLLISGLLKGQEILTNAKIKNLERDYQGTLMAFYLYQHRYHSHPGDDPKATLRFGQTTLNGNGNNRIEGLFSTEETAMESRLVWTHLRASGLIQNQALSDQLPHHTFNGVIGLSSFRETRNPVTLSNFFIVFTNIPNKVALILETQRDDTHPYQGHIQTDSLEQYRNLSTLHQLYLTL